MDAVSTEIDSLTGGVTLSWSSPHDGFQTIIRYSIEIKTFDSLWYEETTYCDGLDPLVLSCTIPMSVFE
jgi:hypothetical protein